MKLSDENRQKLRAALKYRKHIYKDELFEDFDLYDIEEYVYKDFKGYELVLVLSLLDHPLH